MIQTSNPAVFPISLQEAKAWLKVTDTNSDAEILGLIQAGTKRCEDHCNRPFIQREFTEYYDCFPCTIRPQMVSFRSLTSISYVDTDGIDQSFTDTQIDSGSKFQKARIKPAYNYTWPSTRSVLNAVTVVYQAGYGTSWNDVPETVRMAILYLVSHYFTNRAVVGMNMEELPETVTMLLSGEKVWSV